MPFHSFDQPCAQGGRSVEGAAPLTQLANLPSAPDRAIAAGDQILQHAFQTPDASESRRRNRPTTKRRRVPPLGVSSESRCRRSPRNHRHRRRCGGDRIVIQFEIVKPTASSIAPNEAIADPSARRWTDAMPCSFKIRCTRGWCSLRHRAGGGCRSRSSGR